MIAVEAEGILKELVNLGVVSAAAAAQARQIDLQNPRKTLAAAGLTAFQAEMALAGQGHRLLLGPYLILHRIAEGGMGTVYEARHNRLDRPVALKVIRSDKLKSRVVARRFLREIRMTASLEHPHIVKAFDADSVGDTFYLATELIRGQDLSSHVRHHGPMEALDACQAIEHAALALQHIHEHGMVHRDIKPSNLIREDSSGLVKLLDLGLCSLPQEAPETEGDSPMITRAGVLLGTPDYIAPEQARDPHSVDIRADLYSLGCTFYYLLTGRPPFAAQLPVDKLMKHLFEPPPPLEVPGRVIPPAVGEIVMKLMAKAPEDRFQTPAELIAALRSLTYQESNRHVPPEMEELNPFAEIVISLDHPNSPINRTGSRPSRAMPKPLDARQVGFWVAAGFSVLVLTLILFAAFSR